MGENFSDILCLKNHRCRACNRIIKAGERAYRLIVWFDNDLRNPEVYYFCYSPTITPMEAQAMSNTQHKEKICQVILKGG